MTATEERRQVETKKATMIVRPGFARFEMSLNAEAMLLLPRLKRLPIKRARGIPSKCEIEGARATIPLNIDIAPMATKQAPTPAMPEPASGRKAPTVAIAAPPTTSPYAVAGRILLSPEVEG